MDDRGEFSVEWALEQTHNPVAEWVGFYGSVAKVREVLLAVTKSKHILLGFGHPADDEYFVCADGSVSPGSHHPCGKRFIVKPKIPLRVVLEEVVKITDLSDLSPLWYNQLNRTIESNSHVVGCGEPWKRMKIVEVSE